MCHEEEFKRELLCLTRNDNVQPNSQAKFLRSFLDNEGILRVSGWLGHSQLNYSGKFPIILPKIINQPD